MNCDLRWTALVVALLGACADDGPARDSESSGNTSDPLSPCEDPESIAVDSKGTLWLGDLGDNDHKRNNIAIYSFDEPGPGEHTAAGVDRYPVSLPGGPQDVEGLMVHPQTGQVFIVTKNQDGGQIFELPDLKPGRTVQAREVGDGL